MYIELSANNNPVLACNHPSLRCSQDDALGVLEEDAVGGVGFAVLAARGAGRGLAVPAHRMAARAQAYTNTYIHPNRHVKTIVACI